MSSDQQTTPPTTSLWRCFRFPFIMFVLGAAALAVPFICIELDLSTEEAMPYLMGVQMALLAAVVLIGLWWLFFSGFGWATRLIGVLLVAVFATGFWSSIAKFELTTNRFGLVPKIRWIWDPSPEEHLIKHRENQPANNDDLPAINAAIGPEDFPAYRGPHRDGVVGFVKLQSNWQQHPPKVLWSHPCIEGYSGIAVAGNIAVTLDQRGDSEALVCYDRASGRERWLARWPANYQDAMRIGDGPRSTPTIHDHRIYALGAKGNLVCVSAEGQNLWSHNILKDAKATNAKWGVSGSPLIVDDLVVVHAGIDPESPADAALLAYDRFDGTRRWAAGNRRVGYSSPLLATLGGVRQILLFAGDGLAGCDSKDGKELWFHPWLSKFDMNSIQPIVFDGDRVFISSEVENGSTMLRVKAPADDAGAWSVETLWTSKALGARFANPVSDGKHIWGLHGIDGFLTCIDVKTGKRTWRSERRGPGQLLLADGMLIVVDGADGTVFLMDADGAVCNERGRFAVFDKKTWNTPALAGNQLFLRNQTQIVCVELPTR